MKPHASARTAAKTRAELVSRALDLGKTKAETARHFATTPQTLAMWVDRVRREGPEGLRDRSSYTSI